MAGNAARQSKMMLFLPWSAASYLFRPRYRLLPEDPVISLLGRIRAIAGIVMTFGTALYFGSFANFGLEPLLNSLALTALLAIPSMLICMGIIVVATRGNRAAVVRQLKWPALNLTVFTGTIGALLLFNAGGAGLLMQHDAGIPMSGFVAGGIFGLWFLVFAFVSAYLISQYWFNAVDGHPYLQPLMAVWMAWVLAINTLAFSSADDKIPPRLALVFPIAAALVTTGLAAAEALRVRRTLAFGPQPTPQPYPPQPAPQPYLPQPYPPQPYQPDPHYPDPYRTGQQGPGY